MKITVYDHGFNSNEWFVLIVFILGYLILFMLPKRFTLKESFFYVLFGIFAGKFFDHTISINPYNFYDVNDRSSYQVIDFISYLMYGPFSYDFVYFYDKYQLSRPMVILYILAWSIFSVAAEYVAYLLGVYHYKNGYQLLYGFPIYFICQAILLWFYHLVRVKPNRSMSS